MVSGQLIVRSDGKASYWALAGEDISVLVVGLRVVGVGSFLLKPVLLGLAMVGCDGYLECEADVDDDSEDQDGFKYGTSSI